MAPKLASGATAGRQKNPAIDDPTPGFWKPPPSTARSIDFYAHVGIVQCTERGRGRGLDWELPYSNAAYVPTGTYTNQLASPLARA